MDEVLETSPAPKQPMAAPRRIIAKFGAPSEIDPKFHPSIETNQECVGIVETADIPDLLNAFGLRTKSAEVFPFQHIEKTGDSIRTMRIDAGKLHGADAGVLHGHPWFYRVQDRYTY